MMVGILALACVAMAAGMVAMALRLSGLNDERDKALAAHHMAEANSIRLAEEYTTFQNVAQVQRTVLLEDIERLEDDLQNCSTPGAVRTRLRSLARKAKARPDDPA